MTNDSIAIIGISCRYAGCPNPASFWNSVMSHRNCLTPLGHDAGIPLGQRNIFNRPYPVRMGQLGDLFSCVPSMQNFPRQVNAGENQDLYFATQLAFDALSDASMRPRPAAPVNGSVRIGYAPPFNASTVNWLQHTAFLDQTLEIIRRFFPHAPEESLETVKARLVESLPAPNSASFLLGTGYRFASWIARECGFDGPAAIMDAGMLTGAAAIQDGMRDLLSGESDVALVGALTPPIPRAYLEGLSGEVPFSTDTELHPFERNQQGTIPGEGGSFFVLKRRSDALRDHDRIYALIRSVAIGHNSDDPTGIFLRATERVGIPVRTIGLIEADGSGISSQENREIDMVHRLWGEHKPGGPLVGIGSVKGNVGHTLRAAMATGVAKAALALHHRVLPPQLPSENPIESLSNLGSSVYLLNEARPWITGDSSNPRRAAVLGANFDSAERVGMSADRGGRSAVIVLEEEPEDRL